MNTKDPNRQNQYTCEECGARFDTEQELRQHKRDAHSEGQSRRQDPYHCDACGASFNSAEELRAHQNREHAHVR